MSWWRRRLLARPASPTSRKISLRTVGRGRQVRPATRLLGVFASAERRSSQLGKRQGRVIARHNNGVSIWATRKGSVRTYGEYFPLTDSRSSCETLRETRLQAKGQQLAHRAFARSLTSRSCPASPGRRTRMDKLNEKSRARRRGSPTGRKSRSPRQARIPDSFSLAQIS